MPRFTLVTVPMNRANPDGIYFSDLILAQNFTHHTEYDCATEQEVMDAQMYWPRHNEERIIMEYEAEANGYRILGLRQIWGGNTRVVYEGEHLPLFPIDEGGRLITRNPLADAEPPRVNAEGERINAIQSTHTASVHRTVTKSIIRLNKRYKPIHVENSLTAIKNFAALITAENFPDVSELMREAAKRFINRIDSLYDAKEEGSKFYLKHILALVWAGIKDNTTGARYVEEQVALEKFIKHLYEIQRGYNLNSSNVDNGAEDRPICSGGTINKLVDVLNGGLHQDVSIKYVTQATAGEKLKILIKEGVVAYIRNAANKTELLNEINQLLVGTVENPMGWDIPEIILEEIKSEVERKFFREFNSLASATLKEIFEGVYGYVLLEQKELDKITSPLPLKIDDSSEFEDEEEDMDPPPILTKDSVVIKRILSAIGRLERYARAHQSSDAEKHDIALELAIDLKAMVDQFINANNNLETLPGNFEVFKQEFSETLHREDETLFRHRNYANVILANILIALTGIGAFILSGKMAYSYITSGVVKGFFADAKGKETINEIAEEINNIKCQSS